MLKILERVERVEGLHVPLIDENHGERVPRFIPVLDPRIQLAVQGRVPVSCGEGSMVSND